MATNLYEEAIAEARQLREMAEQNAKNKIIDAVSPQIRRLIEQELMGDVTDDEVDYAAEEEMGVEDVPAAPGGEVEINLDTMSLPEPAPEVEAPADLQTSIQVDPGSGADIEFLPDGGVEINSPSINLSVGEAEELVDTEVEELVLSTESARALAKLLKKPIAMEQRQIVKRLIKLHEDAQRLDRVLGGFKLNRLNPSQRKIVRKHYRKIVREAVTLRDHVILSEVESNNKRLSERADIIFKEIKQMSRRRNRALFDRLFEADDVDAKEELDELDAVLTLEPADEDEAEEVEDLLGDLEVEFEIEAGEEEEVEDVEVEAGEEGEEVEEEEFTLESQWEADDKKDDVIEIDEAMLRRELHRMRRLREQEEGRAAEADPALEHGGEDEGDVFVDVDENSLLNALADELGDPGVPTPDSPTGAVGSGSTDAMPEAYLRRRLRKRLAEIRRQRGRSARAPRRARNTNRRTRVNEGRQNRALKGKLTDYRKAVGSLRGQLNEMNLFNAKLLYANKLMQDRNVTPRQQRVIVEALDKAGTLKEAKLLYQSLTASLNKKGKRLSEGRVRRTLGSASKSARSAQPLTEGAGVDRWAVLAGIGKDGK